MDPLSITTGIITLYSTVLELKKLRDSYNDAPDVIKLLERDCDNTLNIILHTKYRLDCHDRHVAPDDLQNPIDIREILRGYINTLYPEVKALKGELAILLRPPETNFDLIKGQLLKARHVPRLEKMRNKIAERLDHFDRLLRSADGQNIDWIRRTSTASSQSISSESASSIRSSLSTKSMRSGDSGDANLDHVALKEGAKLLLNAITGGRPGDVKIILQVLEVSPNHKDTEKGKFPLHVAVERGNLPIVEELLEYGAVPDALDECGQTALHYAARKNMKTAVELLLRKNSSPNVEDNKNHTPLWCTAWSGDSPEVFEILTKLGADIVNYICKDPSMPTALWAAAGSSCLSTARGLLGAGASPNIKDHQGSTLLHKTKLNIASALVPELLAKNADVWAKDKDGSLPLHRAAAAGKTSIVNGLLKCMGENAVDDKDGEEATALIHAAQKGYLPVVQCLTKRWKAKYSARDKRGNGPFYYACENRHLLVATYLLGLGANVSEGNNRGNTPLHAAARYGYLDVVRMLLQVGADCGARSNEEILGVREGATPAEVARGTGHGDIERMIKTFNLDE